MKSKKNFVQYFMNLTWKTSAILGPANRSLPDPQGKHRKPTPEEEAVLENAVNTWEVKTTSTGEHYAVEIIPE